LKVTFLGTGTSQGVPVIACGCEVCKSHNPKDKRLRTSLLIETESTTVVIDSGPDFRQQMLRNDVKKLDAIIYTHSHKDHLAGLDDVRAFNHFQQQATEIYATPFTQQMIKQEFSYIFDRKDYPGIPQVNLNTIDKNTPFQIGDIIFAPIELLHFKMPVLGFRFNDFTYITDANFISDEEKQKIRGTKYLVLNALRRETHISHFTLNEAIALSAELTPNHTYFTHISHQLGLHDEVQKELPPAINLAFDMLSIAI
jgi:phosphoribosyl 1,2-cyclic phosphate phosphodiesterase